MSTEASPHHLEVPGARLYYEVRGTGPLLLVIGQPMTSSAFAPMADLLAADHTVVTYDPHGLGASTVEDPSAEVTPEVQAADLAALVGVLGGGPVDVFATSGGAVAGLAFATQHPDLVGTLIAHEPPVTELLPDAANVRAAVDDAASAYRADGSGAGWGKFVSLVIHNGPVPDDGVPPAAWPPPGAGAPADAEDAASEPPPAPPAPSAKQQADDALFFTRMLKPFTRYEPAVRTLRAGQPRVVIAVGAASQEEVAPRSTRALAEQLGIEPVVFPGDHAGFLADPEGFAAAVRQALRPGG